MQFTHNSYLKMVQDFKNLYVHYCEKWVWQLYSIHILMPSGRESPSVTENITKNEELSLKPTRMLTGSKSHIPELWTPLPLSFFSCKSINGSDMNIRAATEDHKTSWLYPMTMIVSTKDNHAARSTDLCTHWSCSLFQTKKKILDACLDEEYSI